MFKKIKKFFKSKKIFNKTMDFLVENRSILMLAIPFIFMDIFNTLLIVNINYTN